MSPISGELLNSLFTFPAGVAKLLTTAKDVENRCGKDHYTEVSDEEQHHRLETPPLLYPVYKKD